VTSIHHTLRRVGLVLVIMSAACTGRPAEEGAVARGDEAGVRGDLEEALAEYRLALLEGSTDPEVYARIGHTYAQLGKIDEASEYYRQAAAEDSTYADQAVADLVRLARAAEQRGDRFGLAAALESSMEFRPGVSVAEMALPLARYYAQNGEYGRALPHYGKALAGISPDSMPDVLFETGLAYEQVGDCERALVFYEQFAELMPASQRSEVSWRIGECSYRLATLIRRDIATVREGGRAPPGGFTAPDSLLAGSVGSRPTDDQLEVLEEVALIHLERTITLGEPRSRQVQAYFEKGELLSERGECEAAVQAFQNVARVDPSGSGTLVVRARNRIDEIRFGPPLPRMPGDSVRRGCSHDAV
jgi:tetratricopeptide (TPR) repeat protein